MNSQAVPTSRLAPGGRAAGQYELPLGWNGLLPLVADLCEKLEGGRAAGQYALPGGRAAGQYELPGGRAAGQYELPLGWNGLLPLVANLWEKVHDL
jgi:hypothetical protein